MKKINKFISMVMVSFVAFFVCSCASVSRIEADEEVELDGYWSDSDVKIVCNDIIEQILDSKRVSRFYDENGRDPIVTIGKIRNESDEYIDTEIVANNLKTAILKSGRLEFLANSDVRQSLRDEVEDQSIYANEDKAKQFANEDAADFMLTGSIRTMVQSNGRKSFRVYFVNIELNDVETHRTIDIFEPAPENQPRKMFSGKRR